MSFAHNKTATGFARSQSFLMQQTQSNCGFFVLDAFLLIPVEDKLVFVVVHDFCWLWITLAGVRPFASMANPSSFLSRSPCHSHFCTSWPSRWGVMLNSFAISAWLFPLASSILICWFRSDFSKCEFFMFLTYFFTKSL